MKKLLALLLALVMVFALAACGQQAATPSAAPETQPEEAPTDAAEEINLRLYARYSDDDGILRIDYALEKLKEEYPNVNIEIVEMPADNGVQLKTMAATGDLCDIFELSGDDTIKSLVDLGSVKDMTADLKALGYYDEVMEASYDKMIFSDGCVYTMPFTGVEIGMLYANTEIFDQFGLEIPSTIPELIECAKTFSEGGMVTIPLFAKEQWICIAMYNALLTRYVPAGTDAILSGELDVNDPAVLQAAQDLADLAAAGAFGSNPTSMAYENCTELWYNGGSAMFLNGEWEADSTDKALGEKAVWVNPFPAASAETAADFATVSYGGKGAPAGLSVNAQGEHYELSLEIAARLCELWVEHDFVYRGKACFALSTTDGLTRETEPCHFINELVEFRPQITATSSLSGPTSNGEFRTVLGEGAQSLVAGVMTPAEFVASVASCL